MATASAAAAAAKPKLNGDAKRNFRKTWCQWWFHPKASTSTKHHAGRTITGNMTFWHRNVTQRGHLCFIAFWLVVDTQVKACSRETHSPSRASKAYGHNGLQIIHIHTTAISSGRAHTTQHRTHCGLWLRLQSWLMPQSPHRHRNDLKCVEWDVKPCSLQSNSLRFCYCRPIIVLTDVLIYSAVQLQECLIK